MADSYQLLGTQNIAPEGTGSGSGLASIEVPIDERLSLARKSGPQTYELTVDTPVTVDFGGLAQAEVVTIKTIGGKVRVRLTSADGATQAVPVDSYFALISESVPITAIDLTRVSGTSTKVEVFMGEKVA